MSQVIRVSVDESGNILLPASLGEQLHLAPGMTLVVEKDAQGNVRLRIPSRPKILVEKEGFLVARVTARGSLDDAVRRERERRASDLLQRVSL